MGHVLRVGRSQTLNAPPIPVEMVYVNAVVLKPMPIAATATSAFGSRPAAAWSYLLVTA